MLIVDDILIEVDNNVYMQALIIAQIKDISLD
jgi:hypothetical protein